MNTIRMGEMDAADDGRVLRTLLGSCIGLALWDRRRRVGGLAHIVLPNSRGKTEVPGKYVDTAVPELIKRIVERSGNGVKLTAKIAGGADMFASNSDTTIGKQNAVAVEETLSDLRIPIVAHHCGGDKGRRMSFDPSSGCVCIEIVGLDLIEL